MTNLASATAHDRKSVATLTTELSTTNAKLIKALVETTKLTATAGDLRRMTPKPFGGRRHY